MTKDGTNRGGCRVRAGAKPDPLKEKLAAGRPATLLEDPLATPFDFEGSNIGDGAVFFGETMPEPSGICLRCRRMANRWEQAITKALPLPREKTGFSFEGRFHGDYMSRHGCPLTTFGHQRV